MAIGPTTTEYTKMNAWLLGILLYLLVSIPSAMLLGKCIAFGMGSDLDRDPD